jgi:UDP-GlcNAc:undecaprenyl-phosphate/decaprenyl-phosphate GlcNAc-1-phosphate transferase
MTGQPLLLIHLLTGLLALGLAIVATPVAGRIAGRVGLVAYPRGDRWHRQPTPLMGGVAIFVGIVPLFLIIPETIFAHTFDRFGALMLGATIMFAIGLIDDLRALPPYTKLLGQIVAACVLVVGLPIGKYLPWSVLMVPLTIFWVVGVTNAFNLLDNMDGLSAGIAAIVSLTLFAYNVLQGDHQTAMLCLLIAGACGGFLVFNFNPARIFMGDSGSLLIGYLLSGLVVLGASKGTSELALTLLVPVGVMALPILDTTLVTIVRSLHHRPISQGGRDHLSHRLVALGLSERSAVLVLYAVSAAFGILAVASNYLDGMLSLLLGSLLALGVAFFGIYLAQVRIYTEADYKKLQGQPGLVGKLVIGGTWLYKRQVAEMVLDLTLICLGLLAAYLIRFEGTLARHFVEQFAAVLPWIVSIKLATLYAFGAYRSIWRYMGTSDLLRLALASFLGSLFSFAALQVVFSGEGGAPRAVLVIDWLVVTALLVAARMSFVLIRDVLAQFRKRDLVRVLIVGAGDTGELVLRSMARSRLKAYRVVGFLDDDKEKQHRAIHGVRVLGPSDRLPDVVEREGVDEVILTTAQPSERLAAECDRLGVAFRDVGAFFRAQLEHEAEAQRSRVAGAGAR